MIPRYTRKEMAFIWNEANKYKIWFEVELYATEKMEELKIVPTGTTAALRKHKPAYDESDIAEIHAIEAETRHDVIAYLTYVAKDVGPMARFVHQGMTSSDVLDTTLAVQMSQSLDLLGKGVERVLKALKTRALESKNMLCIGRSHGIHAEPVTFGLKLASFYAAFARNLDRLKSAHTDIAFGAISGAVGTFANIDPRVEAHVCKKLGLTPEPISTQVIPRDRHAFVMATLGVVASSIEHLATEIRHLQRTEVREVEEFFAKGQKGSSAMPHKRNPILSENLTGLARIVRAAVIPALENVALWHERDISHSSVERTLLPDAFMALDFALHRLAGVVENMVLYPKAMLDNLERLKGLVFSQRVMLALTQKGVSREDAYAMVQDNAMQVWNDGGLFIEYLKKDKRVNAKITMQEIDELFEMEYHTKHINTIFKRVFG